MNSFKTSIKDNPIPFIQFLDNEIYGLVLKNTIQEVASSTSMVEVEKYAADKLGINFIEELVDKMFEELNLEKED